MIGEPCERGDGIDVALDPAGDASVPKIHRVREHVGDRCVRDVGTTGDFLGRVFAVPAVARKVENGLGRSCAEPRDGVELRILGEVGAVDLRRYRQGVIRRSIGMPTSEER
jgi:hypothetical protein